MAAEAAAAGRVIGTPDDLGAWLTGCDGKEALEPLTFVIDSSGILRLAPRRSEHVACAGGGPVLSAGEVTFAPGPDGFTGAICGEALPVRWNSGPAEES